MAHTMRGPARRALQQVKAGEMATRAVASSSRAVLLPTIASPRSYATHTTMPPSPPPPPSSGQSQPQTVSSQAQPEPSLAPLRVIHPPSHLASYFWPAELRPHYLTLQSLFLELSHVPTTVSSEILGRIRYGWWRDAVSACFRQQGRRYKHPIIVALEELIWAPRVRQRGGVVQEHFEAIISAWEDALSEPSSAAPLVDLEARSERIYSRQFYLHLNLLGADSRPLDEVFSHLGKANGLLEAIIDTPMRMGMKLTPNSPDEASAGGNVAGRVAKNRKPPLSETQRGLALPQEYLAKHGVVEEDVYRQGGSAKGLRDAVFDTATRANDYLITVRKEVRESLPKGRVSSGEGGGRPAIVGASVVPHLLQRLEHYDFDPFTPAFRIEARGHGWRLPLRMWRVGWTGRL